MIEKIMKTVKRGNKRKSKNITIGAVIGFLLSCTAVVGADEYLYITYQLRYYRSLIDSTGSISFTGDIGGSYNWTCRAANAGITTGFTSDGSGALPQAFNGSGSCSAYTGSIGAITTVPSGTSSGGTVSHGSYTNGTYTNVTMTTIPNVVTSEYPVANITVSGGTVTSVTLVSGGAGIGAATSLSAIAAAIGCTGSGFSVLISSFNPGGNFSVAIGDSAAANQRRGNANIAVGHHVALPDTAAGKQLNIGNVIFGTGTYDGTSMSSTATSDSRVSIGTNTQPASAILTLSSTDKGFLPPRMTGSQAEAIASPAEGLIIYSTDGSGSTITSKGWWGYDGSTWTKFN